MQAHSVIEQQREYVLVTPREKEILKLIAYEYTAKEIASMLYISTNTVETHRKNLKAKFKVKNSVGMIRKSYEMGILTIARQKSDYTSPEFLAS